MRVVARRVGAGSALALLVLAATGAAMASRDDRWGDGTLQLKLGALVFVGVLTAVHVRAPRPTVARRRAAADVARRGVARRRAGARLTAGGAA